MSDDPEKLKESFDFLLKVMGSLYNVKSRKAGAYTRPIFSST
jgi:hypothetical protein